MDKSLIENKVKDFLINDLEIEQELITPDALLKEDLGIDSLDFVDIIVIVNREFGFKPNAQEMVNVKTVGQFCDYIESKVN